MFYNRKFYKTLLAWKEETGGKKAALIEGARRIGKSTLVQEFGKNEYKSVLVIDFAKASDTVKEWFKTQINDLDTLFMLLSAEYGVPLFNRGSLIVFDEVQMCPKAREAIK